MKNLFKRIIIIFTFIFVFTMNINIVYAAPEAPTINAQGSVLIDAKTGTIIYGKNETSTFEPASTTKVMTALLVIEKCSLDDTVAITKESSDADGTRIGIQVGDTYTVRELLLGLILYSGNDCANALAIHVSGSIEEFAKLMTERAKELGATNTTFKNPSGLPDDGHLTTPYDLALIMREAIKHQEFLDISTTPSVLMKSSTSNTSLGVSNKNHMIDTSSPYYYPYAIAGKNGYTIRANHSYVAAAEKDGQTLIGSFLYATDKVKNFADMNTVFDYGFNNYSVIPLFKKDEQVTEYKIGSEEVIPLLASEDINVILPKADGTTPDTTVILESKKLKRLSFEKGDKIIKGTIFLDGKEYMTVDLVAGTSRTYDSSLKLISIFDSDNFSLYAQCGLVIVGIVLLLLFFGRDKRKFD